jgi:hypothetical protein
MSRPESSVSNRVRNSTGHGVTGGVSRATCPFGTRLAPRDTPRPGTGGTTVSRTPTVSGAAWDTGGSLIPKRAPAAALTSAELPTGDRSIVRTDPDEWRVSQPPACAACGGHHGSVNGEINCLRAAVRALRGKGSPS